MKTIFRYIILLVGILLMSFVSVGQNELTVHDGTATNNYIPMYVFYFDDWTRSQVVIPSTDLTNMSGGIITSITFYTTDYNIPYTTASTFEIYLKEVDYTNISSYEDESNMTLIYGPNTGEFVAEGSGGKITFENFNFQYNGGNLLITCKNTTDTGWKNMYFYGETINGSSISNSNGTAGSEISPTQRNFIPKTTFEYEVRECLLSVPYYQDFETSLDCYYIRDYDGDRNNWTWVYGENYHSYQSWIISYSWTSDLGQLDPDNLLITPEFIIPNDNEKYYVEWYARRGCNSYDDNYEVSVFYDNTGELLQDLILAPYEWAKSVYPLTGFNGKVVKFIFDHYNSDDGCSLSIDDFSIYACTKPTNLVISNITTNSAHITWESENTNFQWSLDNSTWTDITGTSIDLLNLNAETEYTFYIKSICDENVESNTSQISFTTLKPREQCQVGDNWGDETFGYLPSYSLYNYSLTEQIYTPEEIGNSGIIGRISFYNTTNVSPNYTRHLNIYLAHTNKDEFVNNTDWINATTDDLVFSGEVTMNLNDWTEIILDNTFDYDGINNLVLIINDTYGEWHSTMNYKTYTSTKKQSLYVYQDASAYSAINPPSGSGTLSNKKNQIKLCTEEGWTLPINLLSFTAEPRYDNITNQHLFNFLTIRTSGEWNNCEFIVYRSEDAINWDYDNPVCDWDFGADTLIHPGNWGHDPSLNPNYEDGSVMEYFPIDHEPYDTTYYKLIQRDCDNTAHEYTSEIIVCINTHQKKSAWDYFTYTYEGLQVNSSDSPIEIRCHDVLGRLIYTYSLPSHSNTIISLNSPFFVTVYENGVPKATEKVFR